MKEIKKFVLSSKVATQPKKMKWENSK